MSDTPFPYALPQPVPDLGRVRQVAGSLDGRGLRVGIAVSRYNLELTRALLEAALLALREHGVADKDITVVWVPGAYETSSVLHQLATGGSYDALLGLGVVVQGETAHAGLINAQVSQSLAAISRAVGVPVIDGIVPTENDAQARARCLGGRDSRGWYMGCAAIEMARVFRGLQPDPS